MKKPNINEAFKSLKRSTSKYSPQILTGLGIAGVVTTTVLAIKATPKAVKLVEEEAYERKEELTPMDVVKVTWKCYIPTVISMTTSITCLIFANSVHAKRNAALAAAYKLSETALIEYRDKVVETIGEKKEKVVREKVAEEKIKSDPPQQNNVIVTGRGNDLYLEPLSMRYFYSDKNTIDAIQNKLNAKMLGEVRGEISLNEFYDELGLECTDIGYDIGWNVDELIELDFVPVFAPDGKPCASISYLSRPKYGYSDF